MKKTLRNNELYEAWWNQTQPYAQNRHETLVFDGDKLYCDNGILAYRKEYNGIKVAMVTAYRLSWNGKTQRYRLINFYLTANEYQKRKEKLHFIVYNMKASTVEEHLFNVEYMQKDIDKIYRRILKGTDGWGAEDKYKKLIDNIEKYVKMFEVPVDLNKYQVQRMVLKLKGKEV